MLHQTEAIVLNCIKFGDTSLVAHLYTALFGHQTYMLKGVRKTNKSGASQSNLLLPGTILNAVVQHQSSKNFQIIKEFHIAYNYRTVNTQMAKHALVVFVIELLSKCTQQPETNIEIFELTENTLKNIDEKDLADLLLIPQFYASQLIALLGFSIENEYTLQTPYFDLSEGNFKSLFGSEQTTCNMSCSKLLSSLSNSSFENLKNISQDALTRTQLLEKLLQFYQIHVTNFTPLKSLAVLTSVFKNVKNN